MQSAAIIRPAIFPDEPLRYQWLRNEEPLRSGQAPRVDAPQLSLGNVTEDAEGLYCVEVSCESQPRKKRSHVTKLTVTGKGVMARAKAILVERGASLTEDTARMLVHDFAGASACTTSCTTS